MPKRPVMDPSKAPCGAMTMVYEDYDMLRRWVEYYDKQFGRKHLYVLSHGGDPKHNQIAEGCNVISIPRDPSGHRFNRRRWDAMNHFHAGLMRYYNWFIVSDVDEMVLLDPEIGDSLISYLETFEDPEFGGQKGRVPKSISPFGIELIHNPKVEREPIDAEKPVLQVRRVFRANANYSKPCILRSPSDFTPGGHANRHQPRYLDPHLYLLHLRFYDFEKSKARLERRRALHEKWHVDSQQNDWNRDLDGFLDLSNCEAVAEDCMLSDFRAKMVETQKHLHDGKITFWGGGRTKELYRLPERFSSLI